MPADDCRRRYTYQGPVEVLVVLVFLAGLLVYLQYTTLAKFGALPASGYSSVSLFLGVLDEKVELGWGDALAGSLVPIAFLALLALEFRRQRLTLFFDYIFASEGRTRWFLALSCLVLVRYYFAIGDVNWTGDASAHIAYADIAARSISEFELPIWTNFLGSGTPYLQFYGFLFFYLVGLVDLLFRDLYFSIKFTLAAAHLVSGIGMYMLVRTACGSRRAGFLAGLAFVLCFWHLKQVLIMGRFPVALVYALLPWPFFFFEKLRRCARKGGAVIWGGITLGLLAFAHPGYAFWATVFFVFYVAVRLLADRDRATVKYGLLLLGVGLLFGAYLTLSMWVERDQTILARGIVLSSVPGPSWQHLLSWSNHWFCIPSLSKENAHWYGGYMGISLLLLALIGAVCGLRWPALRRRSPWLAGAAGLGVSLWLVFGYRLEPLRSLPVVQALSAARYLLFAAFFLALMVGVGAQCTAKLRGWNPGRVFSVLLLVVVVDLGPTTLQQPFRKFEFYIDELLGRLRKERGVLPEGELPGERLLSTIGEMHPYLMFSRIYFETGIPSPQADPGKLLKAADLFANPFSRFLDRVLRDLHLAEEREEMVRSRAIAAGLRLLNVRHVLAMQQDDSFKRLRWGGQSPVLVSPRIVGYPLDELQKGPSEEEIDRLLWAPGVLTRMERLKEAYPVIRLIEEMGVDIRENTCAQLLLAGYDGTDNLETTPAVRVDEHQVRNQRVKIQVRVSADCYARLAYAYYPHLQVKVDGREVKPLQTAGGFICLPLEEGKHEIVLEARLSPLRRGLLALDLLLLALGISVSVRERRR